MSIRINHFSHNHPLTEVNGVSTYTCNGCKLYGEGKTYRCSHCNYNLHEYCATCPQSLINSCHGPSHELTLINGPMHMTERGCYVCRVYIQGMFYKCKHCSFESHPLCTNVPMHVPSPDATMTRQRSLHDHAGQPSSPHSYGQGNPYGYPHMGPFGPHPYGGHYPQHQHLNMNPGSPKADHINPSPSTPNSKKKTNMLLRVANATIGVATVAATNLLVATIAGSAPTEEEVTL